MNISFRRWRKKLKRKRYLARLRKAYRFYSLYSELTFGSFLRLLKNQVKTPPSSNSVRFISKHANVQYDRFSKKDKVITVNVPSNFCFIQKYEDSLRFAHTVLSALRAGGKRTVQIDYSSCTHIGADASLYLDLIYDIFITKNARQKRAGITPSIEVLDIIGSLYPQPQKVLFSIGTLRNFKGVEFDFPDIEPLHILVGRKGYYHRSKQREIDTTKTIDYLVRCMAKLERELDPIMETQLYKLIGEVMDNAELHGSENERYSVGLFEKESKGSGKDSGIFSFAIFNFGKTIYEVFKDPDCPNKTVVDEMRQRSHKFTQRRLFSTDFEEESLWTLYALQEGVTSIASKKRGHGTIRLIESFFLFNLSHQVAQNQGLRLFLEIQKSNLMEHTK